MSNILKVELRRAFCNKKFLISLSLGMSIVIMFAIRYIPGSLERIEMSRSYGKGEFEGLALVKWIGANSYSAEGYLFFLILPLLATLPYGTSYFEDIKGGVYKNIVLKGGKKQYFISKYIATFLSGGAAVVIPMIFSLMVSMMFLPTHMPSSAAGVFSITGRTMFNELFYTRPFIYIAVYLIIDFIMSGFIATIALIVTGFSSYRFIVELAPLFIYIFVFSMFNLINQIDMQPNLFLNPSYPHSEGVIIAAGIIIMGGLTSILWGIRGALSENT